VLHFHSKNALWPWNMVQITTCNIMSTYWKLLQTSVLRSKVYSYLPGFHLMSFFIYNRTITTAPSSVIQGQSVSVRRKKWCHKKLHKSLQGLFTYLCQLFLAPWLTAPVSLRLLHPRHMRETWAWVEFQRLNAFIFIFCIQKLSALLCFLDCVFILGKQTL
jgi:hypothetical protein